MQLYPLPSTLSQLFHTKRSRKAAQNKIPNVKHLSDVMKLLLSLSRLKLEYKLLKMFLLAQLAFHIIVICSYNWRQQRKCWSNKVFFIIDRFLNYYVPKSEASQCSDSLCWTIAECYHDGVELKPVFWSLPSFFHTSSTLINIWAPKTLRICHLTHSLNREIPVKTSSDSVCSEGVLPFSAGSFIIFTLPYQLGQMIKYSNSRNISVLQLSPIE